MPREVYYYVLMFFCSAVLGWLMEVTCKLIQFHRFINRGFLLGPYCPIYGFGAVLVTLLLSRYADSVAAVFVLAMVVCGTLEYLTSYVMEKLFHARWWDYSQKKFNLNGRVCADTLIPFGLLGLGMIYFVKPLLFGWFSQLSDSWLHGLSWGLVILFLADTVVSTCVLGKIRHAATMASGDSTEAITKAVRESLARQSALFRRQLHAFPDMKMYNRTLQQRLKARRAEAEADMRARREKFRADIEAGEQRIKAEIKARKNK